MSTTEFDISLSPLRWFDHCEEPLGWFYDELNDASNPPISDLFGRASGSSSAVATPRPMVTIGQVVTNVVSDDTLEIAFVNVKVGARLVVAIGQTDDGAGSFPNPSGYTSTAGLTWTKVIENGAVASSGNAEIWETVYTAGGNETAVWTWSSSTGGQHLAGAGYELNGQENTAGGASAVATAQSTPSLGITTGRDNSIVIGIVSDWSNTDGASRAIRNSAVEDLYNFGSGTFTVYIFHKYVKDAGAAGNFGYSAPNMAAHGTILLYEIRIPAEVAAGNLNGVISGSGTSTGLATGLGVILASASSAGTMNGFLDGLFQIFGNASGSATVNATGQAIGAMTGQVVGRAEVIGNVTASGSLSGNIISTGTLNGQIGGNTSLSGVISGSSSLNGTIAGIGPMQGVVFGQSSLNGIMTPIGALNGNSFGAATLSGTVSLTGDFFGNMYGAATARATGFGTGAVSGYGSAIAYAAGQIMGRGDMQGVEIGLAMSRALLSGAAANTFYIDPSGNDTTGDGSFGNPWKTLKKACDTVTTSGHTIYVNAGTYLETQSAALAVGVNLTGAGAGSVTLRSTLTANFTAVLYLSSGTITNGNQYISNLTFDGQYVSEANKGTNQGIYISKRNNVEVKDCIITGYYDRGVIFANQEGADLSEPATNCTGNSFHDNTLTNCAAYNTSYGVYGRGCLNFGGQTGMLIYNNTIIQNQRAQGYNGWPIKGWNDGWNKGCKIYNNIVTKIPFTGTYAGENGWPFAIELFFENGLEIYGNTIQGAIDTNFQSKGAYAYSMWIHDNVFSQPTLTDKDEAGITLEYQTEDIIIENNTFSNVAFGIMFVPRTGYPISNVTIRKNLFYNIGKQGVNGNNGGAIHFYSDNADHTIDGFYVYNNTFVAKSGSAAQGGMRFNGSGTTTNLQIKNNIFQNWQQSWLWVWSSNLFSNMAVTNNRLYNNGSSNAPYYQAGTPTTSYTYSSNTIGTPGFNNEAGGDYTLASGSACIDAGVDVGLPFLGGAPDIGYAEFVSDGIFGRITGSSRSYGFLTDTPAFTGRVTGSSIAIGILSVESIFNARTGGSSYAIGSLSASIALNASIDSRSISRAQLSAFASLEGNIKGSSVTISTLAAIALLQGSLNGGSQVRGKVLDLGESRAKMWTGTEYLTVHLTYWDGDSWERLKVWDGVQWLTI